MYYVVQEKLFREENYYNLIDTLERFKLDYEIVKIESSDIDVKFKTKRKDVFPFGSVKMARLSKKQNWIPGSQLNENHDYEVYSKYYKENLLNYDSKIMKAGDDINQAVFFTRPTKDTKSFTGRVFTKSEWEEYKIKQFNNPERLLKFNTLIQVSSVKHIQKEIRFWIVKGEIITASVYNLGGEYYLSEVVDDDAYDFVNDMVKIFQLNDTFVMDICLIDDDYKIVECNCTNSAGFYKSDLNKLIMALEDTFN